MILRKSNCIIFYLYFHLAGAPAAGSRRSPGRPDPAGGWGQAVASRFSSDREVLCLIPTVLIILHTFAVIRSAGIP